tara:strand:- start:453 stop:1283 length:831 start_codon:yes stop_codon:yes gene_type:complete
MDRGFSTTVFTRTKETANELLEKGAEWRDNPMEVAKNSDVIFSIVAFPSDVREVFLGANGLLKGCAPGNILVDMTTSDPSLAREIYRQATKVGVATVDAPVSGGDVGAREGRLSIMVGGEEATIKIIRPCFEAMGTTIVHQGGPGSGQHTKMVNQILIASGMIGVCEALLYAHTSGLDLETVMKSVSSGAAGSWSLDNYGPRIINNDFEPGFFVEHFIKDMAIALNEAARMNLSLPGLAMAHQLYNALKAQGGGRNGTQALQLALSRLSAIDWEKR